MLKVSTHDVVQPEWGSRIFLQVADFDVTHLEPLNVPDEKAVSR
jgi:hypothetical protein